MISRVSVSRIGVGVALALDGQLDLGVGRAAQLVHRLLQGQALDGLAVHRGDQVARLDAGARGGGAVDRRDDLQQPALAGDRHAEAAEMALRLELHLMPLLGIHVAAMRIEAGQHAVQRVMDQRAGLDRIDIVGAHALQHLAEQGERLRPGVRVAGGVGEGGIGRRAGAAAGASPARRRRRRRRRQWRQAGWCVGSFGSLGRRRVCPKQMGSGKKARYC